MKPAPGNNPIMKGVAAWVKKALTTAEFTGKLGSVAVLAMPEGGPLESVAFVGLGDELDLEGLRQAAGSGRKALAKADAVATRSIRSP